MNEKLTDERISAYLDNELSPEERADIERQLGASSELRQAVDELRALHTGMQSLPRYRLESNIADRVLQLAEQEVLLGGRGERKEREDGEKCEGATGHGRRAAWGEG
jgi:anti-sigma factor RsiW